MSHRSLRRTLVPFASGLAAVIAVSWAVPALGAVGRAAAGNGVRAQEWWLADLHVNQAWRTTEGAGVTVAVLGTGVAASHADLAGQVVTGPDYSGSGRTPGGSFWGVDGTAVAGVIAGHGHGAGRESGIAGIAPAAKILSIRVTLEYNDPLNSDPAITRRLPGAIASGITYAVDHGARVIDLPLDPGTFGLTGQEDPAAAGGSPAERAAVAYALRRSVVLVAPAGDDGQGPGLVNYPAAYTGVIAVGAVGRDGRPATFSSQRSYVSLTAPGADLVAATPPDSYSSISSTSTASGIVAGVAALIVSRFPHLTAAQVTQALTRSTADPGGGTAAATAGPGTGHGTVDAVRAVDLAAAISSAAPPRPPATPTAKPRQPVRRPVAAPRRNSASASALAGSLVRDVVAALGALIVLLIAALLIVTSRRRRGIAARSRAIWGRPQAARGTHGRRRLDRGPGPAPQAVPPRAALPPGPGAPAAGGWPAPGGWQGGSVGEIAHAAPPPVRPAMAPVPKATPAPRSRRTLGGAGAADVPGGPPWAPAPEPGRMIGPLPVSTTGSFSPGPAPGIRVPPDMTARAAFDVTASRAPDLSSRSAFSDPDGPATIPDFARLPGFPAAPTPPSRTPPATTPPGPTQQDLDFAAAPIPADYPAPAPGFSSLWDLAATDVFPAARAPDDDPGAGEHGQGDSPLP